MSRLAIRRAGAGDAEKLALAAAATFLETFAEIIRGDDILRHCARQYGPAIIEEQLAKPGYAFWLAETATGAGVGFAALSPPDLPIETSDADVELKRIYLLSAFQGGGAGRALLDAAADGAAGWGKTRLLLGVYSGNARAIGFYRATGFEEIGTRPFLVGETWFDDLVFAKRL